MKALRKPALNSLAIGIVEWFKRQAATSAATDIAMNFFMCFSWVKGHVYQAMVAYRQCSTNHNPQWFQRFDETKTKQ